ncbi:methyl-accepting chemotaxis protein [Neptunicella marina]|uniref:Methyl-accepting chemotaxis protein n=1 Tax=Neptunicella marina TaxID=2125989 RepID=A0A8J6ITN3_9ALTE|nr:methyl-accepting chemotaxis protein [Neptunicella marina]MBC3765416.1 methyl-accepting chemotaxis protein [Neptunicella marina]
MTWLKKSISSRLIAGVVASLAVLFILYGVWQISQVKRVTTQNVQADIQQLVKFSASEIKGFFEAKGQIIHSVFASPQVLDWFDQYNERGSFIANDSGYQSIQQYFKFFSEQDNAIKSVFFGSANTFEYFDLNGRYDGDPNYYTNKRPWWSETQQKKSLYVSDPAVDANDGSISATIKTVVKHNGRFIGIGGMDILISTIGQKLLGKIKYQQLGNAFLVTEKGVLVYFPGFSDAFPPGSDMSMVDKKFSDTEGFSALKSLTSNQAHGIATVSWKGENYRVIFDEVTSDYPSMNWKLGFMVPDSVISEPINNAVLSSGVILIVMLAIIAVIVSVIVKPVLQPLKNMLSAMRDISHGEGDLTKRIHVNREDETGQLAAEFNTFMDKIQGLVSQAKDIVTEVLDVTETVSRITEHNVSLANNEKSEIETVAKASQEMAETSRNVSSSAEGAMNVSDKVKQQMDKGNNVVASAVDNIHQLSEQIEQSVSVVTALENETDKIGEVLEVISAITEQTNLLALNAAIEAARAGEQGRGFAVVADEVRTLAQRTQESTSHIQDIIRTLQQTASDASKAMHASNTQVESGVKQVSEIQLVLKDAMKAIDDIQQQMHSIGAANTQQATIAENVARNVAHVKELADESVNESQDVESSIHQLRKLSSGLDKVVKQFRV